MKSVYYKSTTWFSGVLIENLSSGGFRGRPRVVPLVWIPGATRSKVHET